LGVFNVSLPEGNLYSYNCHSLIKSNIQSLQIRRLYVHYDPVMTFKILFLKMSVNMHDFFSYANSGYNTCGHCCKRFTQHCRVNTHKFFFAERVVEPWNSMLATVQDFSSLRVFKAFFKIVDFRTFFTVSLTNWNL